MAVHPFLNSNLSVSPGTFVPGALPRRSISSGNKRCGGQGQRPARVYFRHGMCFSMDFGQEFLTANARLKGAVGLR